MENIIGSNKVKCPLCGNGLPTIEIDGGRTQLPMEVDYHCIDCEIWVSVKKVTDEEKLEMFNW